MDDSIIARLGYDPVRIHTHLYGGPPPPCGIVRLATAPVTANADPEDPPPRAETASPAFAALPHAENRLAADPAEPAPAAPMPAPPEPLPSEHDDDLAHAPPNPAADMQAWLVHNWQAIKALEAAGQLPELAPPEPGTAREAECPAVPPPPSPPVRARKGDRWNKPKMAEFLRQLAATHSVAAAARAVGMSRRSAYKLRARLKGQPFDIAWEAAFRHGYDNLAHAALDRAINGVEVPHYHGGELVGTSRRYDERLTVALLAMRNRAGAPMLGRYGAAAEWWGDRWDALLERVETGSVDWRDERAALGEAGLARLELPDAEHEAERLIARNLPDDRPRGRYGR